MAAVRDRWTDERLDDLNKKVDEGFRRMDDRFATIDQRFAHVEGRLDSLQRLMIQGFIALFGTQLTLFAATVALIVALH